MDVAAVVVTFNRKVLLGECLDALLNQTTPVSMIYLTDNASTDGTHEFLKAGGYLQNDRIRYQHLPENTGGAGGFHAGMKQAYEAGHQWVWLMDDDAEPATDCLERLTPHLDHNLYGAVGPVLTTCDDKIDFQSPHRGFITDDDPVRIVRPVSEEEIANNSVLPIDHFSFVGPIYSRELINSCGLPRDEFFIHFDDLEFSIRCKKKFSFLLVTDAIIKHKEAAGTPVTDIRHFLWIPRRREPFNTLWIKYFGYRNRIWLRANGIVKGGLANEFFRLLMRMAAIICYDDHKIVRLKFWWASFWDGVRGHFDNKKPRKILAQAR